MKNTLSKLKNIHLSRGAKITIGTVAGLIIAGVVFDAVKADAPIVDVEIS